MRVSDIILAFCATNSGLRVRGECYPGIYSFSSYDDCVDTFDEISETEITQVLYNIFWLGL